MTISNTILTSVKQNSRLFIETGSYLGDGVAAALAAGFEKIYSIEFYAARYNFCCERFANSNNVTLLQGDSSEQLCLLLPSIHEKAVFWLDAHYDACNAEPEFPIPQADTFPLLKELKYIAAHTIKEHIILVDDRRIFTGTHPVWKNVTEQDVIDALLQINSQYTITMIDSAHFEKDIIMASL